jgi:putative transposase
LKGRSSRSLQEEHEELRERCWSQHLWARGYFCVTEGGVTKEMIQEYIANQFKKEGEGESNFKVEEDELQS